MRKKSRLILAVTVAALMVFAFPVLAQAETVVTNGVTTTVTGPETATLGEPFTLNIVFETPENTALYANQYPTLTAPTNLDLTNVTYTSTGTSPQYPENNYTITGTAVFNESGVTNLSSPWAHWGYCPAMGFGDKITWDYASFVASEPGDYTFTVAVSGLFWSAEGGAVIIDPANPVIVTHTVTVPAAKCRCKCRHVQRGVSYSHRTVKYHSLSYVRKR